MLCPYKAKGGFCVVVDCSNVKKLKCKHKELFTSCPKLTDCKSKLVLLQKTKESRTQASLKRVDAIGETTNG